MNILIVDDEAIFRDYLKQALDWDAYGFRICGEARNGAEALEVARSVRPDLALVDINMPIMDGLALTEALRAELPDTDVIIVTGHNEFEYARSAIRLGVEDYILKPFSKDELALTLLKCRQKRSDILQAKQTEQADRQLMLESLLSRLVTGESSEQPESLVQRLESFGIRLGERHSVACIEIDRMDQNWNESAERQLWKFAVTNILQETMEQEGEALLFHGPEGRIVCLRSEPVAAENGNGKPIPMLDGYERVCRYVRKYLKRLSVTIGVGGAHAGLEGLRRSYEESTRALRSKFLLGDDRVIYCDDVPRDGAGAAFPSDTNETLAHLLRMGDRERVHAKLDELFRIIRDSRLSLDLTYVACMGWVSVCLSHVTEAGHPIEDCYGEHFFPYAEIRQLETADALKEWMRALFERAAEYVSSHRMTKASIIARNARQYIDVNYGDAELSVERVAASHYINASYLRAVFKKNLGMTAGEYLIHVRMTKAKEMIGSGLRLADIAERVGIGDPAYFSKSFRKFFGVSPSEYENSVLKAKPQP